MEVKTYSRARAAVAAAKKVLEHLSPFIVSIEGVSHGDKFTALVTVKAAGGKEISDAVIAAGFPAHLHVEAVAPIEVADEEQETDGDDELEADDETADDDAPEVAEVDKKRGGYINEHSSIKGACDMVHEIASGMHHDNPQVKKAEVIAECRRHGVAYGTARTQYQKWLSAKNKG